MTFLRGRFPFGADRHDLGLVKAAAAIVTAQGAKGLNAIALFPIEPQTPEQTVQEAFEALMSYGSNNRNPSSEARPG